MNRVAITGAGTINSLGHSVKETLESMADGSCGIGELSFRDVDRLDIKIPFNANDPSDSEFNISSVSSIISGIEKLVAEKS